MQKTYLGKIVKPQGVKGELKIKPSVDNQEIIKNVSRVYFNNSDTSVKVIKIVYRLGFVYLTIEGLYDRTNAENYRNFNVYVDKEELFVKSNEYLIEDLIGLDLIDSQTKQSFATILDIENYVANDIFIVLEDHR